MSKWLLFHILNSKIERIHLIDSRTTHTILKYEKYFSRLNIEETNVNTINGIAKLIEGSRKDTILLLRGTITNISKSIFFH